MVSDTPISDGLIRLVADVCNRNSLDEYKYVSYIRERLNLGAERYGNIDLPIHDGRDYKVEAREELLDAIVYFYCAAQLEESEYRRGVFIVAIRDLLIMIRKTTK